jgi:hypothetical protein
MPDDAATQPPAAAVGPITRLDDPRALQILSTEHWSLLSNRSLAYNEAFTRAGMFLTFLSMSFVALALLAQGMSFGDQFLTVAAVVLGFDFIIGIVTYARINGANVDDLRAVHGMARIRHAYIEAAPHLLPYFTSPTHDDVDSVTSVYGTVTGGFVPLVLYGLTTSGGMIALIVSLVGGVLAGVLSLLIGIGSASTAIWIGLVGAVAVFVAIVLLTAGSVPRHQAALGVRFPAPADPQPPATEG